MDNIFRPSTAFPAVEDNLSVFHDLIGNQIAKDIEKIAAEAWGKFAGTRATPEEEQAYFRKVYEAKAVELGLTPVRITQTFDVIATRTEE